MNKKLFFVFTTIIILVSYIFNVDRVISNKLSTLNYNIKTFYISKLVNISSFISQHFNQQTQIIQLKKDVIKNEQYKILYLKTTAKKYVEKSPQLIKVISYANFNNFSEVILDSNITLNKISALITNDGYSAGVARLTQKNNIGYLNHHPKSNYAVYIGKLKVPGITQGKKNEELITVKFIPLWKQIKVGDEVITSGMDNIFPAGIKVGYVSRVKKLATTWEAYVKPYAKIYNQDYFYIY
jgi:rod shape-determining protein MreC